MKSLIATIVFILTSCSTSRYIISENITDGKAEVYIERDEWTAFGVGICGQFLFNYTDASSYKIILPKSRGEFYLKDVEIYHKDSELGWRREFNDDYYKGTIKRLSGLIKIDITGYKGESVSYLNGSYKEKQ